MRSYLYCFRNVDKTNMFTSSKLASFVVLKPLLSVIIHKARYLFTCFNKSNPKYAIHLFFGGCIIFPQLWRSVEYMEAKVQSYLANHMGMNTKYLHLFAIILRCPNAINLLKNALGTSLITF